MPATPPTPTTPPQARPASAGGLAIWGLAIAVGVVTADSAITTLALPDVARELKVDVGQVAWVLIAYNLVLALVAVPAALLSLEPARGPMMAVGGAIVFALASAGCALAGSLDALVAARVVQALAGAVVITAGLELLVVATGSLRRGAGVWAIAGVAGTAVGPFIGGVLTEALSWPSIFAVQVPLILLALPAALGLRGAAEHAAPVASAPESPAEHHETARRAAISNAVLAVLSAALTAALFLLVLMLIEGWRRSPIEAALAVTLIPLAAAIARFAVGKSGAGLQSQAIAGAILIGGGLIALAYMPSATIARTVVPQLVVGAGLGLTIEPLTALTLRRPTPLALLGGWSIASRHLGIVVGLAILTPIFVSDLDTAQQPAQDAVTALVVDAPLTTESKLALATRLQTLLESNITEVPDVGPAFRATPFAGADRAEAITLQAQITDQLRRAATHAFHRAFLIAGIIALLALVPLLMLRDPDPELADPPAESNWVTA